MGEAAVRQFENFIKEGYHALIIKDSKLTTVQPLTLQGLQAIRAMLESNGAPQQVLDRLGEKRDGHYVAAIPLGNTPGQIAKALVQDHGLPDRTVALLQGDVEITPLGIDDSIH